LEWKMLVYCMTILEYINAILNIQWPFGKVVVIWYIFLRFGIFCS
jgi:hypothetical protein